MCLVPYLWYFSCQLLSCVYAWTFWVSRKKSENMIYLYLHLISDLHLKMLGSWGLDLGFSVSPYFHLPPLRLSLSPRLLEFLLCGVCCRCKYYAISLTAVFCSQCIRQLSVLLWCRHLHTLPFCSYVSLKHSSSMNFSTLVEGYTFSGFLPHSILDNDRRACPQLFLSEGET